MLASRIIAAGLLIVLTCGVNTQAEDWLTRFQKSGDGLVLDLPCQEGDGEIVRDRAAGMIGRLRDAQWERQPRPDEAFQADDPSYEKSPWTLRFNGQSSFVAVDDAPSLNPLRSLTVGAWIIPSAASLHPQGIDEQGYIISKGSGNRAGYHLTTYYNAGLAGLLVTDRGFFTVSVFEVLKPDQRQHVAMAWDGALLQLFVDGQPVGRAVRTEGRLAEYAGPLHLGKAADRAGLHFAGTIDHVRVFSEAIAPLEIEGLGQPVVLPAINLDPSSIVHPRSRHLEGRREPRRPVLDFEDLSGWTVWSYKGFSEASLYRSQAQPLWGQYVAKLTYRAGQVIDPHRKVMIRPPRPVVIEQPFDGISLWVFAHYWDKSHGVKITAEIEDAHDQTHAITLTSREYPFVFWTGWFLAHRALPQKIAAPAKLLSLTFHDFIGDDEETVYIDSLDCYAIDRSPVESQIPTWEQIGAPVSAETILPTPMDGATLRNQVLHEGEAVVLRGQSADERIEYAYRPRLGTLSDLTLNHDDHILQPARGGGLVLEIDGTRIDADSERVTRTLQSLQVRPDGVDTLWQWQVEGNRFDVKLDLTIRHKSLIVDLAADTELVSEVRCGQISGAAGHKLVTVPYLVLRGGTHESSDPAVLSHADGPRFLSVFTDWFYSEASELFGQQKSIDERTAIINGGAVYYPKTDGRRNPPRERLIFTASRQFAEVLPNIPNPPNPWLEVTKSQLWATRMWYVSEMPYPGYYDEEFAFWHKLRQYGVERINLRQHVSLYRQYVNRNGDPYTMVTDTEPGLGGDEKLAAHIRRTQRELGYDFGLYTNYTLISPLNRVWDENLLALSSDGQWRYGSVNAAMVKPGAMLRLQQQFNPQLKRKFDPRVSYADQFTCRPAWALTDYDARTAEAGKFAPVLRVFARLLQQESRHFGGPVLSEGIMQWKLAGYADSYAQPSDENQDTLVDFALRRTHLLSNDCGYHLNWVEGKGEVDRLLAAQIAYGHIGHLYGVYGGRPPARISGEVLKSYFMMQQLQEFYATTPVDVIRYHHDGELLTTEAAIAADVLGNNQVYLRYANGLEVYVNRHREKDWRVAVNNVAYVLPPHGFVASLTGRLLSYSATKDGHRVDLSLGPRYIYVDGRGRRNDFGGVTAAHSHMLETINSSTYLTPTPFVEPEDLRVWTALLAPDMATASRIQMTPITAEGERLTPVILDVKDDHVTLPTTAEAFKYQLRRGG